MIYFLASKPLNYKTKRLNPANGFIKLLTQHLSSEVRALFVCADPQAYDFNDCYAADVKEAFEVEGIIFSSCEVLDNRTAYQAVRLVERADLIFLAGGHVPTQNAFLNSINLANLLKNNKQVLVGTSAGSMNAAECVYAQPEEPGEGISKDYRRFLNGLGITKVQLIPHYQETKDYLLDGLRLFEDITYPDSVGHTFYAICDGGYLYGNGSEERIFGEAFRIKDGVLSHISSDNGVYQFRK